MHRNCTSDIKSGSDKNSRYRCVISFYARYVALKENLFNDIKYFYSMSKSLEKLFHVKLRVRKIRDNLNIIKFNAKITIFK